MICTWISIWAPCLLSQWNILLDRSCVRVCTKHFDNSRSYKWLHIDLFLTWFYLCTLFEMFWKHQSGGQATTYRFFIAKFCQHLFTLFFHYLFDGDMKCCYTSKCVPYSLSVIEYSTLEKYQVRMNISFTIGLL